MPDWKPFPTWHDNPFYKQCQCLVEGTIGPPPDYDINGQVIAMVEDFGYACYPSALNPLIGQWERNGPTRDRVEARQWCERVAGLHPTKEGDGRPAFYYQSRCERAYTGPEDAPTGARCERCKHEFRNVADYDRPAGCLDYERPAPSK